MSTVVHVALLLLGLAALVYGVVGLVRSRGQWIIGGIILIIVGIVLLAAGGFVDLS